MKTALRPAEEVLGLWHDTRRILLPLRPEPERIPSHLAQAVGADDKFHLTASAWTLGGQRPVASCRTVKIEGTSSAILNTLIFPRDPRSMPVFVAEMLVFGGRPRLAFVDVQGPGLAPAVSAALAVQVARLARRFAHLPPADAAPPWAVECSLGGTICTKPEADEGCESWGRLYRHYLRAWVRTARFTASGEPSAGSDTPLARFKRQHLAHWPGTAYLTKVFGADWAHEFLTSFLYR